ncbi:MAG: MIP/aquaporin family protein [Bacteroidales bacterium]
MIEIIAEFIGTMLLVLLGDGVVANVLLKDTKGHQGGWIVIAIGWGLGVFAGVAVAGPVSGAHINPAVTIGLATAGLFPWESAAPYIAAQLTGGAAGAFLVWLFYYHHFNRTEDPGIKLACYCTGPAIRRYPSNMVSEVIGTFVLIFVILYIAEPFVDMGDGREVKIGLGTLGAIPVALLVTAIGLSLGGTTGYAINPARDLGPRIMHAVLPMKNKGRSDWAYAWVPVAGPLMGALIAAALFLIHQWLLGSYS